MLISIKAASVGLNLTCANHVVVRAPSRPGPAIVLCLFLWGACIAGARFLLDQAPLPRGGALFPPCAGHARVQPASHWAPHHPLQLLDLWWNPTVEEQAIDRAHRIGQTRPVSVVRFVIKGGCLGQATAAARSLRAAQMLEAFVDASVPPAAHAGTIEDQLLELQKGKRQLVSAALGGAESSGRRGAGTAGPSLQDLVRIFETI